MSLNLSQVEKQVILYLKAAHEQGQLGIDCSNLKQEKVLSEEQLKELLLNLYQQGIIDRVEADCQVSLSARGLRLARNLAAGVLANTEQTISVTENTVQFNKVLKGNEQAIPLGEEIEELSKKFIAQLQVGCKYFDDVLEQSSLSKSDKNNLSKLFQKLFTHPAIFELMKRAVIHGKSDILSSEGRKKQ